MGIRDIATSGWELLRGRPLTSIVALSFLVLGIDLLRTLLVGEMGVADFSSLLWTGLMQGLIIGLAGIGLSMTYSILNFANFAHGDYITAGAFTGWSVTYLIAGYGAADAADLLLLGAGGTVYGAGLDIAINSTPLAIVGGILVAGLSAIAVAILVDRSVFKAMRNAGGISLLIASVGVAFAVRYLIVFIYTPSNRGTTAASLVPKYELRVIDGMVQVDAHDLTILAASAILMVGVHVLLQRTKLGKAMRAMADNENLALVTGIPTERIIQWTWIIGGGLTGVAGYLTVLWRGTITFRLGWFLLLLIFAAVILGGIGSIYGAILGGVLIGLTISVSQIWIPTDFARAAAFALMIIILLLRPQGIFAGRTTA